MNQSNESTEDMGLWYEVWGTDSDGEVVSTDHVFPERAVAEDFAKGVNGYSAKCKAHVRARRWDQLTPEQQSRWAKG